jgi:uncharacterized protein (TIGR00251 family)
VTVDPLAALVRPRGADVWLDLRVTPRASKTAIEGLREGRLVVKVTAPPVDAAANDAVIDLMAKTFSLPKRQVTIALGATGRQKTIALAGVSAADVRQRLSDILG